MKGSMKMSKWVLALVIGLVMGLAQAVVSRPTAASVLAQASDPVAVVDAFHAAGDDIEAALALLTNDVVIELRPPPPNTTGKWTGKEEARKFFEWKNANNQDRMRAGDAQVEGNIIRGNVGVTSDIFTRLGLGTVGHTFQAEVVGGKLKAYLGQLDPKEQDRVTAAFRVAQQGQLSAVALAFLNSFPGDPEATLALMTDDPVVSITPPPPGTSGVWSGKEAVRQWNAFRKTQASSIRVVGSPQVEGNKVTLKAMIDSNNFRTWGTGSVEHTIEIVVEGAKVKLYTSIMAPAERERVAAAARAAWAPTGMPRTGGQQPVPFSLLLALSMLTMITVGVKLRSRPR